MQSGAPAARIVGRISDTAGIRFTVAEVLENHISADGLAAGRVGLFIAEEYGGISRMSSPQCSHLKQRSAAGFSACFVPSQGEIRIIKIVDGALAQCDSSKTLPKIITPKIR